VRHHIVIASEMPAGDCGGALARIIHEDVLQTQQIGSCRCFEGSGDDGDPERVVEVARFLKVTSGAERPAMPAGCAVWGACS